MVDMNQTDGRVSNSIRELEYKEMKPKQKREYGFIKLSTEQISIITSGSGTSSVELKTNSRPSLSLIVNK